MNPADLGAREDLADLFVLKRDLGRAEAEFEEMKKRAPNHPGVYVKYGALLTGEGKLDKALVEYGQALRLAPDAPAVLGSIARIHVARKRFDLALSLCEDRIKKNGNDALAYAVMGQVYGAKGDLGKAEAALKRAMEVEPSWTAPLSSLAQVYVMQGRGAAAVKSLEDRLKAEPGNASVQVMLAKLCTRNGDYKKAIGVYEELLRKQPGNWAVANDLAFLLADVDGSQKSLDRARNLVEKALGARPDEPTILDTAGWIAYRRGETDRALDLVQKAYLKLVNDPTINYHMGMISYKAGKPAQAKDYLSKAVKSGDAFHGREEAEKTLKSL
jgi:tetratricopeptide (TPR) repeat protein